MIDTHCHLTFPDFESRVPEELAEAARHGVSGCITISTTPINALDCLRLATTYPNVWSSAGIHPLYADQGPFDATPLRTCIAHERCVAWGELGLDNHYNEPTRAQQEPVLRDQLALIREIDTPKKGTARPGANKPIVVHCREAFDDLIPILKDSGIPGERFVFHCFTAGPAEAKQVLDFGAMISYTGVATYNNAKEVLEAAVLTPADRLMVETDAPYLSPQRVRGQRPCRPWMVSLTAKIIAGARGESYEDFERATDANAERFFGIRIPSNT
ncbi:MAG: TatD family hydrolase [Phycisphaera sp.]|nr:MAG: TatD family hydrolase [Phycisphaera sp.]